MWYRGDAAGVGLRERDMIVGSTVSGETVDAHHDGEPARPARPVQPAHSTDPATSDQLDTMPPTAPIPEPPVNLLGSRYVLDSEIGTGATGRVWRASRRGDATPVAVKVLREEFTRDPDAVVRFLRQRTVLRTLEHPHLVRVHDLVAEGDVLAVVMDLVEGEDLRRLARRQVLRTDQTLTVLGQVAGALAVVHAAGVVHRDIKPENVLVCWRDGAPHALLTDFGLAGAATGPTDLTRLSQLMGTPAYIAPEMVAGRPAVPATDVYAFGVMAYELLGGERPFRAPNTLALLRAHVETDPTRPPRLAATRWDRVWDLLRAMLEKDPETRPTAAAVASQLAALGDAERLPPPVPPPPPSPDLAGSPPVGSSTSYQALTEHREVIESGSSVASLSGTDQDEVLTTTGATRPAEVAPPPTPRRLRRRAPLVVAVVTVALFGAAAGLWFGRPSETPPAPPGPSQSPLQEYHLHVSATSPRPGQISLEWDQVHETLTGSGTYAIYRGTNDDRGTLYADAVDLTPPYLIPELDEGTEYCWRVIFYISSSEPPPAPFATEKPTCTKADGT
jgi:serine/threonine-protein kinase